MSRYLILKNYFAPKDIRFEKKENFPNDKNTHAIKYDICNFNCEFCFVENKKRFHKFDEFEFAATIINLLQSGNAFKFTGGEPTLNPNLERDLNIVKKLGGKTYLDTNGSLTDRIRKILSDGLVDVLAVSLKGLTPKEALKTSKAANENLAFLNPLKTIRLADEFPNIPIIVTYVCHDYFDINTLEKFITLLPNSPNIFAKFNNLMKYDIEGKVCSYNSLNSDDILKILQIFSSSHPEWKNRMVFIGDKSAVSNHEDIIFL